MRSGDKEFAVINGKKVKQYNAVGSLVFSPDSKRTAYAAKSEGKWFVVIDGKESSRYDDIKAQNFNFDSGSKHIVYTAQSGKKWLLVTDGKKEK
ncbi:MAG: hypothetical protein HY759_00255 [Nitrospirae bacterium]|nr:hypothetical protein [Nitrospirota bacterium]